MYSFVGFNNLMELKMLGINPVDVILDMGKQRCFIYTSRRVNKNLVLDLGAIAPSWTAHWAVI